MTTRPIASGLFLLCLAAILTACGSSNTAEPEAVATPHFVNDLSNLSSRPVAAIDDPKAAYAAMHPNSGGLGHAFEDQPGMRRHVGTETSPAVEQLLNPKAAQFSQFSTSLLDKMWGQLRLRESDDDIAKVKVPTNIQPVVLTATLAPDGKLKEIVVEQHSGKAIIDQLFISAAKKAIWAENPPKAAAQPDGTYQVRIEGRIENFASTTANRWTFTTYVGIALM